VSRTDNAPAMASNDKAAWMDPGLVPSSSAAAFADKERATRALQALIGRRRLANLAARCLAARPRVLDALLGVIGDYVPPRALPRLLVS